MLGEISQTRAARLCLKSQGTMKSPTHKQGRYLVRQVVEASDKNDPYEHQSDEFKSRPKAFKRARDRCREFPSGSSPIVLFQRFNDGGHMSSPNPGWNNYWVWTFNIPHPEREPIKDEAF